MAKETNTKNCFVLKIFLGIAASDFPLKVPHERAAGGVCQCCCLLSRLKRIVDMNVWCALLRGSAGSY